MGADLDPCCARSSPAPKQRSLSLLLSLSLELRSTRCALRSLARVEDFKWRDYFRPDQLGTFLALRGKEAVKGVGVAEQPAAKLVRTFGDVESMMRVEDSALKSWDVKVRRLLGSEEGRARLARNAEVFGFLGGTADDPVADDVVRFVAERLREGKDEGAAASRARARVHPMFQLHFDRISERAARLVPTTSAVAWRVVVDEGWYVDAVLDDRVCVVFVEVGAELGAELGAEAMGADYTRMIDEVIRQALGGTLASYDPFKLRKSSASGIARYLGLLKQRCRRDVLLLPVALPPPT